MEYPAGFRRGGWACRWIGLRPHEGGKGKRGKGADAVRRAVAKALGSTDQGTVDSDFHLAQQNARGVPSQTAVWGNDSD